MSARGPFFFHEKTEQVRYGVHLLKRSRDRVPSSAVWKCNILILHDFIFRETLQDAVSVFFRKLHISGRKQGNLAKPEVGRFQESAGERDFPSTRTVKYCLTVAKMGELPVVPGPTRKIFLQTPSTGERPGNFSNHRHRGKAESGSRGKTYRESFNGIWRKAKDGKRLPLTVTSGLFQGRAHVGFGKIISHEKKRHVLLLRQGVSEAIPEVKRRGMSAFAPVFIRTAHRASRRDIKRDDADSRCGNKFVDLVRNSV